MALAASQGADNGWLSGWFLSPTVTSRSHFPQRLIANARRRPGTGLYPPRMTPRTGKREIAVEGLLRRF